MVDSVGEARVRELVTVPLRGIDWFPPPPPPAHRFRVLAFGEPCPRVALKKAAERAGVSLAALSRLLGRRDGYLATFVREGHPAALSTDDHRRLADFFGLTEREIGVRDLWAHR